MAYKIKDSETEITGALTLPKVTTAEREAGPKDAGIMVYDTDLNKVFVATGSAWVPSGASVMTGATLTQDGESGLVPQPLSGQMEYYLSGVGAFLPLPRLKLLDIRQFVTAGTSSDISPQGTKLVYIVVQAGGGSGGGINYNENNYIATSGGSGGDCAMGWVTMPENKTFTVVVGAGGAVSTGEGNDGGYSQFSFDNTTYRALGGSGAVRVAGSLQLHRSFNSTNTFNATYFYYGPVHTFFGRPGTAGEYNSTSSSQTFGGDGGDSFLGRGGRGANEGRDGVGTKAHEGVGYGSGGGGVATSYMTRTEPLLSTPGQPGAVLVSFFG